MVDVTSLHIGISINAINSCLAVAVPTVYPARFQSPLPSPLSRLRELKVFFERFLNCYLSGDRYFAD